ncbi:MAG: hypothetical protein KA780_11925, partial [Prolixibacteraceae bacterium]|nr:hypothetical protein [Prolixibacteraceae bacterium]
MTSRNSVYKINYSNIRLIALSIHHFQPLVELPGCTIWDDLLRGEWVQQGNALFLTAGTASDVSG